ncbi:MAG: LuxR C-terminal-related transcriptional regulator [Candidatus Limnocylindrales bacterium]
MRDARRTAPEGSRPAQPLHDRRGRHSDRRAAGRAQTTILTAHHQALVGLGIASILAGQSDFAVLGEAADTQTAVERANATSPNVILIDLALPPVGGIETVRRIKRDVPAAAIILLAVEEDDNALVNALKAGAAAFMGKDVAPDELVPIIRRVAHGEYPIHAHVFSRPALAARVLREFRELVVEGRAAAPIFAPLSPREAEILDHISQGASNKEVAYALSLSEQTVKNHMSSVLRKLAVNDRTQAVVHAIRRGWIRLAED